MLGKKSDKTEKKIEKPLVTFAQKAAPRTVPPEEQRIAHSTAPMHAVVAAAQKAVALNQLTPALKAAVAAYNANR
jgi:hypothetical protein